MNYKMIGRILSVILGVEAILMLPALFISVFDGDAPVIGSFLLSIGLIAVVSILLFFVSRNAEMHFYAREGFVCVGLSWIAMSLLGCLPFWFSGQIPKFIDALFEMVSGFTTTGASIVPNVESLSRGILYWRSFSHWIGGMGVLVFVLAIVPLNGRNSGFTLHLMRAESPGPSVGKLSPKLSQTAKILYIIYIALTVLDVLFLLAGRMPLFDAFCAAFGTAGTGGFGIKADSMTSYSPYLQNVTTIFMFLFGVNFTIFYLILMKKFKAVAVDEELRAYFGVFIVSTIIITSNIMRLYPTVSQAISHASFQVASIMTTTGYATADFNTWPVMSKTILLCLMIPGASAGSTGGGMKWSRIILLIKSGGRGLKKLLYPRHVDAVRFNGNVVDEKIVDNTNAYLAVYIIILISSFLLITIDGFSIETNISAVISCFNNIGPGLDQVGPALHYANYSSLSKGVLIFCMLAGRLEIFPILVLFARKTWTVKR